VVEALETMQAKMLLVVQQTLVVEVGQPLMLQVVLVAQESWF
tara:strand:+ start:372 stop:497 length:126 start_codon:yes stop_codon:yes gene_type:complete